MTPTQILWSTMFLIASTATAIGGEPVSPKSSEKTSATRIEYDQSPSTIVLVYDRNNAEMGITATQPMLRVYGDGRVLVHRPFPLNGHGDYELRLSNDAMMALLTKLDNLGVFTFDLEAVQRMRAEIEMDMRRNRRFFTVSDGTEVIIGVKLSYEGKKLEKRVAYWNPDLYGPRLGMQPLIDLAAADQELLALTVRQDLKRTKGVSP